MMHMMHDVASHGVGHMDSLNVILTKYRRVSTCLITKLRLGLVR